MYEIENITTFSSTQKEGIDQKIEGWQQVIIKDNGGHDSTDIKQTIKESFVTVKELWLPSTAWTYLLPLGERNMKNKKMYWQTM